MGTSGPEDGDDSPAASPTPQLGSPTDDDSTSKQPGYWGLAFQSLSDKNRTLIEAMAAEQSVQSFVSGKSAATSVPKLEQLIDLAKEKMEDCDRNAWKIPVQGGRHIILRDVAAKIIGWLNTFKAVGDTAVQYDPVSAALPWAAVRFFIQVAVNEQDQMHHLLTVVETVTRISSRCRVYELVYPPDSLPEDCATTLQESLVSLYSIVFRAIAHSYKLFYKNTTKRILHAMINPQKTQNMMLEIADHEASLQKVIATCEAVRIANIESVSTKLVEGLKRFEAPLTRVDSRVSEHMEHISKKERMELLQWISPVLFGSHHEEIRDLRTPGTCDWLLKDFRFEDWHSSSSSACLLLYGIPGAGKTFLTSRVVDWVNEALTSSPSDEAFAFFYCKRDFKDRNDPLQVLRSYVRQLSTSSGSLHADCVTDVIRELHDDCSERGTTLTFATCRSLLVSLVNLYPKSTFVLDAMDECDRATRKALMETFDKLMNDSSKPVKVFISSRRDVDVVEYFDSNPTIQISATDNNDDIAKFVNTEIKKHPRWSRMVPKLQEEIKSTLLWKSDGMFQWAALQIKQLLDLRTTSAIQDRLGKLPATLKDAYDEIYAKIDALHPDERQFVIRAFQWVMCAREPLTTETLLGAISLELDQNDMEIGTLNPVDIDETDILEFAQNLLVVQEHSKIWSFPHLSVIEYLETSHFNLSEAHCSAACATLAMMGAVFRGNHDYEKTQILSTMAHDRKTSPKILETLKKQLGPELFSYGEFAYYSFDSWWHHVVYVELEAEPQIQQRACRYVASFFGRPDQGSEAYDTWMGYMHAQVKAKDRKVTAFFRFYWVPLVRNRHFLWAEPIKPIHLAGMLGLRNLLSMWWDDPKLDVNQAMWIDLDLSIHEGDGILMGVCLLPLISMIALNFNTVLLEHLVRARSRVVEDTRSYQPEELVVSPLWAAAISRSPDPLQLLLENVPDTQINVLQTSKCPRPLTAAVCHGADEAVRLLLKANANPNLPAAETGRYKGSTFLAMAAKRGNLNMVKQLVLAGADVNADAGDELGSALAAAATVGIQEFLISAGADMCKVLEGTFDSALKASVYRKSLGHVRSLLAHGADPSGPTCPSYGTPLTAAFVFAATATHFQYWEEDFQHWEGGTVAKWRNSKEEAFEKGLALLEAGAEVNTTFKSQSGYCSALDACFHLFFRPPRLHVNPDYYTMCYRWMSQLISHGGVWRGRIEEWKFMADARLRENLGRGLQEFEDENDQFDFWHRLETNNAAFTDDWTDLGLWESSWATLLARYQYTCGKSWMSTFDVDWAPSDYM